MANLLKSLATFAKRDYTNFDMGNHVPCSMSLGSLNRIYGQTVLAGDTWKTSHNVNVKVAPLVVPAFTRINGLINTFYCSYSSVWKYWNNFIADMPDDAFLNTSLKTFYNGAYVEPCVSFLYIAMICKVAYGHFFCDAVSSGTSVDNSGFTTPLYDSLPSTVITWKYNTGYRQVDFEDMYDTGNFSLVNTISGISESGKNIFQTVFGCKFSMSLSSDVITDAVAKKYGFYDSRSMLVYCCQQVCKNLVNFGVPCELIAASDLSNYSNVFMNVLPVFCQSFIWQNYFRNIQLQGTELNYRCTNGHIFTPSAFFLSSHTYTMAGVTRTGWRIELNCLPPNLSVGNLGTGSTGSPLFFDINSVQKVMAVLTGYGLKETIKSQFSTSTDINSIVLPDYYNGLLQLKYRNFSGDYFSSAAVDPMSGADRVEVPNTIDELRTASKIEEFLERKAWSRDFYNFMTHEYGAEPESAKYDKPLLLGTQRVPIMISEQLQTSASTDDSPLGSRAGVAEGYGNQYTSDHYFNEHGQIISYLSFIVDAEFCQGLPHQLFHHGSYLDYPHPDFANLGPEQILSYELYFSKQTFSSDAESTAGTLEVNGLNQPAVIGGTLPNTVYNRASAGVNPNDIQVVRGTLASADFNEISVKSPNSVAGSYSGDTFGYIPRYSKWKMVLDEVHGEFRDSLDVWHTFRLFHTIPKLSHDFISYQNVVFQNELNRIFAVEDDLLADKFYCNVFNNCSVRRWLPYHVNTTLN